MTDPRTADDGRGLQAQAERLRRLIEETSVESVSDDYAVRVTVGPGDTVLDVEVTSRALGRSGDEIGELIVAELRKASAQLGRELNEKMGDVLGTSGLAAEGLGSMDMPSLDEIRREREALHEQRVNEKREQDR